jgi:nicotinamidase-related amidase
MSKTEAQEAKHGENRTRRKGSGFGAVPADRPWPQGGSFGPGDTALVIIDMQVDFCAPGGWVDQLGEDYRNTHATIQPVSRVLARMRELGFPIMFTREGHLPDLSDLPANKRWRTRVHGLGIGDQGESGKILVRGEPGWEIVPELAPRDDELVIDKPGKSTFWRTDFESILEARGISKLVVTGVTTDCCVQSTIRDAFDRGYESLLLTNAVAAVERQNHEAAIATLTAGAVRVTAEATVEAFLEVLGS